MTTAATPYVLRREAHSINGKKYGMFFHLADGQCVYLAWRSGAKTRGLFFAKNAWCIDTATLRECAYRGCQVIGIAHKVSGKVAYYLTLLSDFWGPDSEPHPEGKTPQRRLCREHFRVNTTRHAGYIASKMRIK